VRRRSGRGDRRGGCGCQAPAADTARDAARKPAEIVDFAGVKPGDKVAEMIPGGGYYTRILAKTVGPTGHVYLLVPPFFAQRPGGLDGVNALAANTAMSASWSATSRYQPAREGGPRLDHRELSRHA